MNVLDKLPALVRHLLIVAGSTYLGVVVQAVIAAQGVTGVAWSDTLVGGLDNAAVAVATAFTALWLTPITRQYGVGATDSGRGAA